MIGAQVLKDGVPVCLLCLMRRILFKLLARQSMRICVSASIS